MAWRGPSGTRSGPGVTTVTIVAIAVAAAAVAELGVIVLGPDDTAPRSVRLSGLPDDLGGALASALSGNADTGYLLRGSGSTVYRSLDGLRWWPLRVEAPA